MNVANIIENDDLISFKQFFVREKWRETIAEIKSYADSKYVSADTTHPADCFKYAIHYDADKIVDFLLPQVSVEKHGSDYGFPVMSMAVEKNRYDYAYKIINHPTFNPYAIYHRNTFSYFNKRKEVKEHIIFLFEYLNILSVHDIISDSSFKYYLTHLVCHDEQTYEKLELYLKKRCTENSINLTSVLDIYRQDNMEELGRMIFNNNYIEFMAEKLTKQDVTNILNSSLENQVYFTGLFESSNSIKALKILLKDPVSLEKHFYNNVIYFDNLSLDCLLFLDKNGINVWKSNKGKRSGIDFILREDSLHTEKAIYYLENHTQKVLNRINEELAEDGRDSPNVRSYILNKNLQDSLKNKPTKKLSKL